ncbi:MAG: hypothetical protein AB7G05_15520 [Hyphomonadaceae bacterium]
MRGLIFLGLAAALGCASAARPEAERAPPSAEAVFDRYLAHRGEGLAALRVIERIGWISVATGEAGLLAGTYHTCLRYPDRVAVEVSAGPWNVTQALRADGPVACEPGFADCRPASQEVAAELLDTAQHANKDLLHTQAEWRAATVSLSQDGRAWRLSRDGGRWAEFDLEDGHLRALGAPGQWRRLGRWRSAGGVTFPHRLEDYAEGDNEWRNTVELREIRVSETPSAWCVERFGAD